MPGPDLQPLDLDDDRVKQYFDILESHPACLAGKACPQCAAIRLYLDSAGIDPEVWVTPQPER